MGIRALWQESLAKRYQKVMRPAKERQRDLAETMKMIDELLSGKEGADQKAQQLERDQERRYAKYRWRYFRLNLEWSLFRLLFPEK